MIRVFQCIYMFSVTKTRLVAQAILCGQLVSSSLLDRILVNFYHCFSGVAQVCRDAAGSPSMVLLSLHPNIIVHVENVVSLFSSPSTSSQKVRKCGCLLSQAMECGQLVSSSFTSPELPKFAEMLLENGVAL